MSTSISGIIVFCINNTWHGTVLSLTSHKWSPVNDNQSKSLSVLMSDPSVIKSLIEAAFLSSSVVAMATATVSEPVSAATASPEIPSPSTSEASFSVAPARAPVSALSELPLLQVWKYRGYTQLPATTIFPVFLWKRGWLCIKNKTDECFLFYYDVFHVASVLKTITKQGFSHLDLLNFVNWDVKANSLLRHMIRGE